MSSHRPSVDRQLAGGVPELLPWWLGYVAFVVYGSLVPLNFRSMPWDQAWDAFQHLRLLDVGTRGRADWVANGVLYLPVGFLTASLLMGRSTATRVATVLAAMSFVAALALGVEFAQVFFPPRTVSLNDLFAEFVGGGLGVVLALVAADRLRRLLAAWLGGVDRFAPRLLKLYALAYCAYSFFPYDFLVSANEVADKLSSESWGWLWAGSGGRGGVAAGVAKLFAEALAAAPVGWLMASRGWVPGRALAGGAALGAAIEVGQFFLVSGVAQGFSVLTRAAGVAAGAVAWGQRGRLDPLVLADAVRRFGLVLIGLYLLALVAVTGWFELSWRGWAEAASALAEVRYLPFYYHYYTTEQAALLSLTSVCLMYAPVGALAWAYFLGPGLAGILAALMAAVMESSKLFLAGQHPDPTNLIVAAAAAWLACRLGRGAEGLARRVGPKGGGEATKSVDAFPPLPPQRGRAGGVGGTPAAGVAANGKGRALRRPGALGLTGLAAAGATTAWGVVSFPFYPAVLGLALMGYGLALWYRPHWLWVVVPAALALLDLAPWSGRFFFDEFDLLLLVTVAVGYARLPPMAGQRDRLLTAVLLLVGTCFGIAALRGLLPWQHPDINSFTNYYSPFNALRIAKGVLWAFLLYGLMGRFAGAGMDVGRLFGRGMVVGLAGTVAVVVWERAAFPGLFNFSDVYRVTGPFSSMHTGEADIEAYLVGAVPFLALLLVEQGRWPVRLLGTALLAGAAYAVMVTFSRAGFAGFGVALVVALAGAVRGWSGGRRRGLIVTVALAVSLAAASPILLGPFAQERLSRISADLAVRQAHWWDALAMRDPGIATLVLGMGLGRFPETHYWRSSEQKAASYQLIREDRLAFLRLGSGSPLYFEQRVAVQPGRDYVLTLQGRAPNGEAQVSVSLCEKWLLTSARCVFRTLAVSPGGDWQAMRVTLPSGDVGKNRWFAPRPIKLSLYSGSRNAVVDVASVGLTGPDGTELLTNGDFAKGMDRWFFTVDVYLPWHISSLPVTVLFELGGLGLLALGGFAALALWRSVREAWTGDPLAGAILGVLLGWILLGIVDSLMDSPRMLFLILVVVGIGGRGRWGSEQLAPGLLKAGARP